jgi:hypothetical protein
MAYSVRFEPASSTLFSNLSGILSGQEVEAWEAALYEHATRLGPGTRFQFVDDLHGYEVADQDPKVHQKMRVVTPRFLADHAFAVGFWRLYEQVPPPATRPSICRRVAHVHHDCAKMERYTELLGSGIEAFFCDAGEAHAWVAGGREAAGA